MPTRGRPEFAAHALQCFFAQTWEEKELLIIDDAACPSFPDNEFIHQLDGTDDVHYFRLTRRLSIGAKRNLANARSSGDLICHWDDDDYSAPGRIEDQVRRMEAAKVPVTGYHSMLFRDGVRTWKYRGDEHYALGTSLMYAREFWRSHPFPDENEGEDNHFVRQATRIATADAGEFMVATIHAGNTSDKRQYMDKACWEAVLV